MDRKLFIIHRLTGLIAGIMLLLISCTGALLVFSDEIDEQLYSQSHYIQPGNQPLPLSRQFQAVRNANSGNPYIMVVKMPQASNETTVFRAEYDAQRKIYCFVNPYTAQIVDMRGNTDYFMGKVLYFHFELLSGKTGAQIILVTGILLACSLLSGIWIYRKSFAKVLSFRLSMEWSNPKRRWRNLHRITGVWSVVFLTIITTTGIIMEQKVIASRKGNTKVAEIPANVDYDQLLVQAEQAIPGLEIVGVRPPKKAGAPIKVLGHAHESSFWGEYASNVSFSIDGKLQKVTDFSKASFADKFNAAIAPLHFGNFGGIFVKIIWSLFGLTPGLLSMSGFLIWYRRRFLVKSKQPVPAGI
ncbi:PepSY domain-containing protein [Chitinophaga sp. Cy-1792]|uniref:PepSY-associated TM helix domain-containing protein n=1 Tax=Chitinophaga sp. Cy-1792 TaxID=2608339 RepID=UPI001420E777|nr:PepSY-associated TM helix domain-containing protein [Chitinophaga sp. Cy-1792]NIG57036.1 PepSY domain-containing protein [Chitinophaga sp. Cy-1792]